jgi:hypothetical protein
MTGRPYAICGGALALLVGTMGGVCLIPWVCRGGKSKPPPLPPREIVDYSNFSILSPERREKIAWDLHDKRQFGWPEHKPICLDLLIHQGRYGHANATSFTSAAIAAVEKYGWTDLAEPIRAIYEKPTDIWLWDSAVLYLRALAGKPVPRELREAADTVIRSGWYETTVTDRQLERAKRRLMREEDKELVLLYGLLVGLVPRGKGGTDRHRLAAAEILKSLAPQYLQARLRAFRESFEGFSRSQLDDFAPFLR